MTATADIPLLHTNGIDLSRLPDSIDLAALIRQAQQDPQLGSTCSWVLSFSQEGVPWYMTPALLVGVRGDVGAVAWSDEPPMVPTNGTNPEPVDYWLGGLHHTPMEPHTEIPIEQALAAVDEFVRTGQRPTCVEWRTEGARGAADG
ncbi:Imm1 family immunity protein [Haloactinomyces albus]|uniref:Immunity protein Imm1 n=1 Tax=Haloactinomyces albus TaxID=1352928 RepID=A0AAE3ZDB9_9ACTN|nr:Imm1 family immunity protein [Haloactinomyces albus]MDR7301004.1 hypothetical protein [Haloactinomyces albus]